MQKNERNYGIDLLRLISMFMVVTIHVIGWGGLRAQIIPLTLKGEILKFIEITCYCAVNCYAIISGYVGVTSKHKYSSIIYLWIQVLFYSLIAGAIYLIVTITNGAGISFKALISNFFPFIFEKYWYFTAYVLLFFFMPLLNFIIDKTPQRLLKTSAIVVLVFFCCVGLLRSTYNSISRGYSVLWLAIMYLVGGYIAKYNTFSKISSCRSFLYYIICIGLAFGSRIVLALITSSVLGDFYRIDFLIEYNSPLIVASALFLFNTFRQMYIKKGAIKCITLFAPASFGVYLIHENSIIRGLFIEGKFIYYLDKPFYEMIGLILLTAIIIFIVCIIIDFLRIQLFKLFRVKKFSVWLETRFSKIFSWISNRFRFNKLSENIVENSENSIK